MSEATPTPAIIPRWEWRTFGVDFGPAEDFFAALSPDTVVESDEIYLRSGRGAITKVRNDLLDVKQLQAVSEDGLEQWVPVMKAEFPLPASVVSQVLALIEVSSWELDRDGYTLEQFLEEVIAPHPEVAAIDIHKVRNRYKVGGCMAELTDLVVDGRALRTIAIESEDPDLVRATVNAAGLGDDLNHNFVQLLTALLEDEGPRFAVIDVGTNSVKFHIAERTEAGQWSVIVDRAEVTRLGEGLVEGGRIKDQAMARTIDAISGMVDEARSLRVKSVAAVATAGMRAASNRDQVVEETRRRTGITVAVISGEEESRLAYQAVKAELGLDPGSLVVFDTGGGSSQFTFGSGDSVSEQYSVPVGAVRFTEAFGLDGPVSADVVSRACAMIATDLSSLDDRPRPEALVGMGGAITNLTAVSLEMGRYDPDRIQGATLERSEIERQIEMYRTTPLEERRSIVGLQPKRAEVILAGACIVATVMDKLGQTWLTVSDRGLRHGLLTERFGA